MKTLKALLAATFMALSICTFAGEDPNSQNLSMDYALKTYINAFTSGKVKGFSEILDSDVKFTVARGQKIVSYSKSEMLNIMRNSENITQNCITDYSIVEQSATQAIVKVNMKYDSFSKVNYVTMAQTKKGWKITNVSSEFV
jgi:hypothetical protein